MKITVDSENGLSWIYFTGDEISVNKNGEVKIYATDTDGKWYRDNLNISGKISITIEQE